MQTNVRSVFALADILHQPCIMTNSSLSLSLIAVFHVTDQQGKKITDRKTIDHIEQVL